MFVSDLTSPIGIVRVVADEQTVLAVSIHPEESLKLSRLGLVGDEESNRVSLSAVKQLEEYFAGERKQFDLPVYFGQMSQFSLDILTCLAGLPYGEILTYGILATLSGHPQAARAVGRVMAANPIPIIVPCHRIIGSGGKMVGYSGGDGVETKEWLLAFEKRHMN